MVFDDPTLAPYQGREPYLFISYSHKNAAAAAAIIRNLNRAGFRVWYDQGLIPGREWDENVAHIILGCSFFLPLITREYLASSNCRDELNYARDKEKPMLLVYLEDIELPAGMDLRLGRLFAVHRSACSSEEVFYSRIFRADGIARCNRRYEAPGPASAGKPNPAPPSRQKKNAPPARSSGSAARSARSSGGTGGGGTVVGILLLLLLAAAAAFLLLQRPSQNGLPPQPASSPSVTVSGEQDSEAEVEVETTPEPEDTASPSPDPSPTPTPDPAPTPAPTPTPSSEVVLPGGQSVISDPQEAEQTEEPEESFTEEDNLIVSSEEG